MAIQSEWLEKDYYQVLGVPASAGEEEISRAYRRLARQLHPDVNPNNKEAEERFKEASAAYDVIGDPAKRKEYDEARNLLSAGPGFRAGGGDSFAFRIDDLGDIDDVGGVGDLFADLLGGGRHGRGRRGTDLEAELELSFEEAVLGVTTEVEVTHPCGSCGGRGRVIGDVCTDCRGLGARPRRRRVRVRIPPGVDNGQVVRIPGRGAPGPDGGPSGDLYVVVRVGSHPLFGRDGRHLTVTVPITYPEAVLGAEVKVPTLDGSPVTIRIPPGTRSGRTLRVRGRGVPDGSGRGDLSGHRGGGGTPAGLDEGTQGGRGPGQGDRIPTSSSGGMR